MRGNLIHKLLEILPEFEPARRVIIAEKILCGYINAQIDRISVTPDHVYIIDYKSNRPPPKTQDGVADIYWGQMAAYRALAREIYPKRKITCALLWTDGPYLMPLADDRLDMALTQIAALPT